MKKIILLTFFVTSFLNAQNTGTTDEQSSSKIKVYTPSSSAAKAADSYKWTVKTDLFSFASGEFPIIAEYRFAKKLSAEVSAGLTFGLYDNFGIFNEGYDGDGSYFDSKPAMGSSFRGGVKFYPSSDYDAIEGWAFGLQVFSRKNNREYTTDNYGYSGTIDFSGEKDSRTKTGIALTISKQIFWDSNISFEYLIGIGIASVNHEYITENGVYDPGTGNTNYSLVKNSNKETVPNIQLGCRIGFGN